MAIRPVGRDSGRWARGSRLRQGTQPWKHRSVVADRALPMLVQLVDLELEVVHGALDAGLPLFVGGGHLLQCDEPGFGGVIGVVELLLPLGFQIAKVALQLVVLLGELLLEFLQDELGVRIRRAQAALKSREVVVGRGEIQDGRHSGIERI